MHEVPVTGPMILEKIDMRDPDGFFFQSIPTNTLSGDIYVEYCGDPDAPDSDWLRDPELTTSFLAGERVILDVSNLMTPHARVGIENVAGSGDIKTIVYAKGDE